MYAPLGSSAVLEGGMRHLAAGGRSGADVKCRGLTGPHRKVRKPKQSFTLQPASCIISLRDCASAEGMRQLTHEK